jgi:hypothetical protein
MKKQLTRISVLQSSKVFAILYFLFGFFYTFIGIVMVALGGEKGAGIVFIFMPLLLGVFGFLFFAVFCAVYNLIAGWVGGIEVEVTTIDASQSPPLPGSGWRDSSEE